MSSFDLVCVTMVVMSLSVVAFVGIIPFTSSNNVSGFDVAPTVDSAKVTNSKSIISQQYRFGEPQMKSINYSDGWSIPTVTMSIELWNQTTNHWDVVGYTNTHLHKVKVDATDKLDLSVGHTDRFNPKVPIGND